VAKYTYSWEIGLLHRDGSVEPAGSEKTMEGMFTMVYTKPSALGIAVIQENRTSVEHGEQSIEKPFVVDLGHPFELWETHLQHNPEAYLEVQTARQAVLEYFRITQVAIMKEDDILTFCPDFDVAKVLQNVLLCTS
jgi:predicted NUDIX family NTP pyrophosphohydrolase